MPPHSRKTKAPSLSATKQSISPSKQDESKDDTESHRDNPAADDNMEISREKENRDLIRSNRKTPSPSSLAPAAVENSSNVPPHTSPSSATTPKPNKLEAKVVTAEAENDRSRSMTTGTESRRLPREFEGDRVDDDETQMSFSPPPTSTRRRPASMATPSAAPAPGGVLTTADMNMTMTSPSHPGTSTPRGNSSGNEADARTRSGSRGSGASSGSRKRRSRTEWEDAEGNRDGSYTRDDRRRSDEDFASHFLPPPSSSRPSSRKSNDKENLFISAADSSQESRGGHHHHAQHRQPYDQLTSRDREARDDFQPPTFGSIAAELDLAANSVSGGRYQPDQPPHRGDHGGPQPFDPLNDMDEDDPLTIRPSFSDPFPPVPPSPHGEHTRPSSSQHQPPPGRTGQDDGRQQQRPSSSPQVPNHGGFQPPHQRSHQSVFRAPPNSEHQRQYPPPYGHSQHHENPSRHPYPPPRGGSYPHNGPFHPPHSADQQNRAHRQEGLFPSTPSGDHRSRGGAYRGSDSGGGTTSEQEFRPPSGRGQDTPSSYPPPPNESPYSRGSSRSGEASSRYGAVEDDPNRNRPSSPFQRPARTPGGSSGPQMQYQPSSYPTHNPNSRGTPHHQVRPQESQRRYEEFGAWSVPATNLERRSRPDAKGKDQENHRASHYIQQSFKDDSEPPRQGISGEFGAEKSGPSDMLSPPQSKKRRYHPVRTGSFESLEPSPTDSDEKKTSKAVGEPIQPAILNMSPHCRSPSPDDKGSDGQSMGSLTLRRSPMFNPAEGPYSGGSFGMEIAPESDFFPPFTPSQGFGDDPPPDPAPFGVDGDPSSTFDPKLTLTRSASGEGSLDDRVRAPRDRKMRRAGEGSPFSSFVGELSPLPNSTLTGSPLESFPREFSSFGPPSPTRATSRRIQERPASLPPLSSKRTSEHPANPHHMLKASPVTDSASLSKMRRPPHYDDPMYPSPGPFRVQLGSVGMKHAEARRGMEGINTALKSANSQQSHPLGYNLYDARGRGYDVRGGAPPITMGPDIRTPIKLGTPGPMNRPGPPMSTGRMPNYPATPMGHHMPVGPSSAPRHPNSAAPMSTPGKASPSSGKENESPKSQRRNPCNCKKSKCLKLYCECFAAELYCDGCNCSDCSNTKAYEAIRSKAIKDTKAKNPNAFKPRIAAKPGAATAACASPQTGHNMGCRCKKSACLKKYCECFEAGVMCGNKCKCVDCLNYIGSQALIDRRRKIKDHRGAELAMRSADEAWKGGRTDSSSKSSVSRTPGMPPHPPSGPAMSSPPPAHRVSHPGHPAMTPVGPPMGHPAPSMMHPGQHYAGPPPPHGHGPPMHPYMGGPPMMGGPPPPPPPPMGYHPSHMGMHPTPPPYSPHDAMASSGGPGARGAHPRAGSVYQPQARTPVRAPRGAAVRVNFDPKASKRKRGVGVGKVEPAKSYFGPNRPEQPKTAALMVFSFLSNDDIYNASLVSKGWSRLSMDEELWQF